MFYLGPNTYYVLYRGGHSCVCLFPGKEGERQTHGRNNLGKRTERFRSSLEQHLKPSPYQPVPRKSLELFTQERERLRVMVEQVRLGGQSPELCKVTLIEQALKGGS